MVNEINKPPSSDNIRLSERLSASNRQLQEMQEEHRQLIQEMEMLRQRAAELSRLNAHFSDTSENNVETSSATAPTQETENTDNGDSSSNTGTTESEIILPTANENLSEDPLNNMTTTTNDNITSDFEAGTDTANTVVEDENPEVAQYLQEKLTELATLKAQFKRVQNMVSTTDLIEKHLSGHRNKDTEDNLNTTNNAQTASHDSSETSTTQDVNLDAQNVSSSTSQNAASGINTENEELMSAMMNMFTEFTSDLRSQAEDLRAERDRIRALKEELLRRRQQS